MSGTPKKVSALQKLAKVEARVRHASAVVESVAMILAAFVSLAVLFTADETDEAGEGAEA